MTVLVLPSQQMTGWLLPKVIAGPQALKAGKEAGFALRVRTVLARAPNNELSCKRKNNDPFPPILTLAG